MGKLSFHSIPASSADYFTLTAFTDLGGLVLRLIARRMRLLDENKVRRVFFPLFRALILKIYYNICIGFLINVGTRDETPETSGSLLALKNTYLKTLKHTNETINYGMIQMSGGDM